MDAAGPAAPSGGVLLAVQLGLGTGAALIGVGLQRWGLAVPLVLIGGAVAVRALRQLLPIGSLTARRGPPAAIASMALITFAFFGTEAFVPLALSHVRHAPVLLTGLALTAAALTWTAGAWVPVRLAARVSRRTIVVAGLAILAVGIVCVLALLAPAVPAAFAVVAWGIAGFGMGLAFTTTSAAILETAEPGQAGVASASLQLAQVLGAAIGTGLGGAVVAASFAGDPPVLGIGVVDLIMLAAAALAIVAARRIPSA
jgi:MFS family permease